MLCTLDDKTPEEACPICQDALAHPISLPCEHTFCYLCLKGVFARNGACPMCRRTIPQDLVTKPDSICCSEELSGPKINWMYEAKNGGWWLYEKRHSDEIEKSFTDGKCQVKVQISGFVYIIDFEEMVQYRSEKMDRRRKIKRETTDNASLKGVAGIPLKPEQSQKRVADQVVES